MKNASYLKSVLFGIIVSAAGASWGQVDGTAKSADTTDPEVLVQLPPYVLVAHRSPMPLDEVSPSVFYLDEVAIETRQYQNLSDVVEAMPGITIVPQGQQGAAASQFTRGSESNHTAILLNGRKLPSGFSGQYDLGALSLDNIGSVEVIRGPSSSLYGADAIGGVIDLRSRQVTDDTVEGSLSGEFGSFDTRSTSARFGVDEGAFSVTADASYLSTDNDRPKSDFERRSVNALVEYEVAPRFVLDLQTLYYETDLGVPGDSRFPIGTPFGTFPADQRNEGEAFLMSPGFAFSFNEEWALRAYYSYGSNQLEATESPFFNNQLFEETSEEVELVGTYAPDAWPVEMSLGVSYGSTEFEQTPLLPSFSAPFYDSYYRNSIFGQAIWDVTSSLRLIGSARFDDYTDFDSATTGNLEIAHFSKDYGTRVFAKLGTGYAPPVANDLSRLSGELRPEESFSWEVGVSQPLFDERVTLAIVYFETDIENLVDSTFDSFFNETYSVVDTEQSGVEVMADWRVFADFSVSATYTYLDAKVVDGLYFGGFSGVEGDRLIRRPKHKITLNCEWEPGERWILGVGLLSEMDREDPVNVEHEDFAEARVFASFRLTEAVTLFARVENLFDEEYTYTPGFEAPGQAGYFGVKLSF